MGCTVNTSCPCGYQDFSLPIGGGLMNFTYFSAFPAYCPDGDHLVIVNMFDNPLHCSRKKHKTEPIPYNDNRLIGSLGQTNIVTWGHGDNELTLTNGMYFCPVCHEFTLSFADGDIMWD